jgi:hypothetical protein
LWWFFEQEAADALSEFWNGEQEIDGV